MSEDQPQETGDGTSAPEPTREEEAAAGRHLTNAIMANIVAELRDMGGDELVERVRVHAGEQRSVEDMTFLLDWSTPTRPSAFSVAPSRSPATPRCRSGRASGVSGSSPRPNSPTGCGHSEARVSCCA